MCHVFPGPFASALAIRFSHRSVTIVGGLLAASGLMLSYFATSIPYLYVRYVSVIMPYVRILFCFSVLFSFSRKMSSYIHHFISNFGKWYENILLLLLLFTKIHSSLALILLLLTTQTNKHCRNSWNYPMSFVTTNSISH
jgi:hypothetical protein